MIEKHVVCISEGRVETHVVSIGERRGIERVVSIGERRVHRWCIEAMKG